MLNEFGKFSSPKKYVQMSPDSENKLENKKNQKRISSSYYTCYTYIKDQIYPKAVMKFWTHD